MRARWLPIPAFLALVWASGFARADQQREECESEAAELRAWLRDYAPGAEVEIRFRDQRVIASITRADEGRASRELHASGCRERMEAIRLYLSLVLEDLVAPAPPPRREQAPSSVPDPSAARAPSLALRSEAGLLQGPVPTTGALSLGLAAQWPRLSLSLQAAHSLTRAQDHGVFSHDSLTTRVEFLVLGPIAVRAGFQGARVVARARNVEQTNTLHSSYWSVPLGVSANWPLSRSLRLAAAVDLLLPLRGDRYQVEDPRHGVMTVHDAGQLGLAAMLYVDWRFFVPEPRS